MRSSSGNDVMYFLKPGHQPACQCQMRANRLFGFLSYRFRILQFSQLCFSVIFDLLAARPDWPQFKIDWFTGKSHDGFAPMGPFFVPAAFVPDYGALRLTLKVNGDLKQDGLTGEMVFSVEEQIEHEQKEFNHFMAQGTESFQEAMSYFPEAEDYNLGPEEYLQHIKVAKEATAIPIIGSLNGVSAGGWLEYAKRIEEAGADALELNVYYIPTNSAFDANEIENIYLEELAARRAYQFLFVALPLKIRGTTASMLRPIAIL